MDEEKEVFAGDSTTVLDRTVINTVPEIIDAAVEVASLAKRELNIFSQNLSGELFRNKKFIETVRQHVISSSHTKVRVLVSQPVLAAKNAQQFLAMIRQLSSHMSIRCVGLQHRNRSITFVIADDRAIIYHPTDDSVQAMYEKVPMTAKQYLNSFEDMWDQSAESADLRQLSV